MNYQKYKLDNGSTLGIINIPSCYTATVSAFVKAGFRYDPEDKPGLAHFTEHMLFNGTKKYPTPAKLAWAVERFGGWQYAFTWVEHQQHTIHLPKKNFVVGLDVLLEKLANSLLSENECEREKSMIKEEILRNRSDPEKAVIDYAWQPLFYKGTSLDRPYSGREENIDKIASLDVKKFIQERYLASSTVFIVASNLPTEMVLKAFNKYALNYKRRGEKTSNPVLFENLDRLNIVHSKAEHTLVILGIKTVPLDNDDRFVMDIIKDLLAGFYGSRLPQRLRNAGLIYNWDIWQDNFQDFGYLLFRSSTASSNIDKFIEIILSELERLTKETVSRNELEVIKGHITGDLFCNIQTGFDLINWFGLQELILGDTITLEKQARIYQNISADQILKTAKEYITKENIYLAILGNADEGRIKKIMDKYFES